MTEHACPCCEATGADVEFLGVHHEIVTEFRCLVCDNEWSD
jgi:hypothetical protein